MSRSIAEANNIIFRRLDDFCASRGVAVLNSGAPRWIDTKRQHNYFISKAVLIAQFQISLSRKIIRLDLVGHSYYLIVGLNFLPDDLIAQEVAIEPSHLVVLLSEVMIRPIVSPYVVKDVIEADDYKQNTSYPGHDLSQISVLFPDIRVLRQPIFNEQRMWRLIFRISVDECKEGDSWVSKELAETLISICDLDPDRIPYKVLCKSIFDGDPANFFLALYRCLEALYAYSSSTDLIKELSLSLKWPIVAVALEETLGWHPKEEGSLERLLRLANSIDLKSAVEAITSQSCDLSSDRLVTMAARRIYKLRNSIVHFRPAQHALDLDRLDWVSICISISCIVLDIYNSV